MPQLNKHKIRKILLEPSNGAHDGFITLHLQEPLVQKRVSSTWFPKLFQDQKFSKKGDTVLEFYHILKPDPFNNLYSLRGYIAEQTLIDILTKKGYTVETQIKEQDPSNPVFKYFNGIPDIIYTNKEGVRHMIEVKSKSLSKKSFVESNPPETEILQGKMLAMMFGFEEVNMTYFFFDDALESAMQNIVSSMDRYDNEKAYELFKKLNISLKLKENIDIVSVKYDIDKKLLLESMKKSYKYAETFRQTLTVPIPDLSKDVFSQIFKLKREIEDGDF